MISENESGLRRQTAARAAGAVDEHCQVSQKFRDFSENQIFIVLVVIPIGSNELAELLQNSTSKRRQGHFWCMCITFYVKISVQ